MLLESFLRRCRRGLAVALVLSGASAPAQVAVPVGAGSHASSVPESNRFAGGFFSMTAQQVVTNFANLHLDPARTNGPIPTSRWWTDLLVGDRSFQPGNRGPRVLRQDDFGGALWAYPAMVDPEAGGLKVHFPNSWVAPGWPGSPGGVFDPGPAIEVGARVALELTAGELLLADFEGTSFPPGWTASGAAFGAGPAPHGTWPGQAPAVTGFLGSGCANSARGGSDGPVGTLISPEFRLQHRYLHLLVGGGSNSESRAVRLLDGTNVLRTASGRNSPRLHWNTWDVSAWTGTNVRIQIVDASTGAGGWGYVTCDYIVASDDGGDPEARYRDRFAARRSMVTDWGDWHVSFRLADALGRSVDTTLARGVPFVWTTWRGLKPRVRLGSNPTLHDPAGAVVVPAADGTVTGSALAFEAGGRWLGVFGPAGCAWRLDGDQLELQPGGAANFLVLGLLPARTNLVEFAGYAMARVSGTELSWDYQPSQGRVVTRWRVRTTPLEGGQTNALQGWLPHAWRTTGRDFEFLPYTYETPRGRMQLAAGTEFEVRFPFRGLAPVAPAPRVLGVTNDYDPARLARLVERFAQSHPAPVGDSYGAGKEFGLAAQHLTFARQMGLTNTARRLGTNLARLLADWLSYTPGEKGGFFARYDNWRALVGFPPGFGSEAFNDHQFHYGYFTLAGALLAMEEPDFLAGYGPMLRQVAKEYANWDRRDADFPFLRTFDTWAGHSWASGFASADGNNLESSSESLNAWAGLFQLGAALEDDAMVAAGAMGWAIESAAVNEYWQDWKRENFPAGYGRRTAGIVWSGRVTYGTYFSGDPAWIYGIQWVPANHWNQYLARDPACAADQFASLWKDRASDGAVGLNGFRLKDANNPVALDGYLGNYVLGFQALFDPAGVAAVLEAAAATNATVTTDVRLAAVTYYLAHALRAIGREDPASWTSLPTSQAWLHPDTGRRTFLLHNYARSDREVTLFHHGVPTETVSVPARSTRVITRP